MSERYAVHTEYRDDRTGDRLAIPIVSVLQGARKLCRIYGQHLPSMQATAHRICGALIAYDETPDGAAASGSGGDPASE